METAPRLIWWLGVTLGEYTGVVTTALCGSAWASLTTESPLAGQVRSVPLVTLRWHLPLSRGPVTSHVPVTLCHAQFLIATKCCCHNHCCCCYCHNDQIATKESPAHWPAHCKHNQIQSCFVFDSLILSEILHQRLGAGNLRWCNDICAIQ